MNDLTLVLEQARRQGDVAGERGVKATAIRRCACVLALILLFLTVGVGRVPDHETTAQELSSLKLIPLDYGLTLETRIDTASADTLAAANQEKIEEPGSYAGAISTRARFKTH